MPDLQTSAALNPIRQLPAGLRDSSYPYTAKYYELPLTPESGSHDQLLLDFRLQAPQPQDAWIQFVQVLPNRIVVQRFRASEYRDRPIRGNPVAKRPRRNGPCWPFRPSRPARGCGPQPVRPLLPRPARAADDSRMTVARVTACP